ncbi:MAG: hypothetical protein ACLP01_01945 [Solirubrobacteraceae bacterium]
MTAAHHPLVGARLAVEGRRRVHGVRCLIVRLPDGTPGTVEVSATSAAAAGSETPADGVLLSVEGGSSPAEAAGTGRLGWRGQRHVGSPPEKRQLLVEVNPVRGLESTPRQLALSVEGSERIDRMWESFSPEAQERILRLLARAIARILEQQEKQR